MKLRVSQLILLILPFLISSTFSNNVNPQAIIKKSFDKCQSINSGNIEITKSFKSLSGKDTSNYNYNISFKKVDNDTIYSSLFHIETIWKGKNTIKLEAIYSGQEFATLTSKDSTATIMSNNLWAKDIKANSKNYIFYSPITSKYSSPFDIILMDSNLSYKFLGESSINHTQCYQIDIVETGDFDSTNNINLLRKVYSFWIAKDNYIPVQYRIVSDIVINKDTMHQYENNVLNKFDLNNSPNNELFTLQSIPKNYIVKDFVPSNKPILLKADTFAPNWTLKSIDGNMVSLDSFKNNVVLIDFFYKTCFPCLKALPFLQSLNDKYRDKGLKVIGIDPYDLKDEKLASFLTKKGVTYPVVFGTDEIVKQYGISAYPTLFLIDKQGKIIYVQEGYGIESEKSIEDIIIKSL